jgi:hypothetical protein
MRIGTFANDRLATHPPLAKRSLEPRTCILTGLSALSPPPAPIETP